MWDQLCDVLTDLEYLQTKNEAWLTFDLPADFCDALRALPAHDSRCTILRLLDIALRHDIHFIARHAEDYLQGLFQCLWNNAWWYDCPEAAQHYAGERPPGEDAGMGLHRLLESWRARKEARSPGFVWVRSLRPPDTPLGGGCLAKFEASGPIPTVALSLDGSLLAAGGKDGVRIWETTTGRELGRLK